MKTTNLAGVLCIALAALPPGTTSATQVSSSPTVRCDVEAYVIDRGTTNVRSGPGKTFKTVGSLPNQKVEGIRVHITGYSGDWLRIDKAEEEGGESDKTLFAGEGWVSARLLSVSGMAITRGGTNLYQQMSEQSRVVVRVPGGEDRVNIRGCREKWMKVEYKQKTGWAAPATLCANSLTTCS